MIVNVNGTFIHYIEHGHSDGLPLVFLHGFPFSGAMWQPQLNFLPDSVRAIAPDMRGSGAKDVGDGQYTIDLFVDDLISLARLSSNFKSSSLRTFHGKIYIAQRALPDAAGYRAGNDPLQHKKQTIRRSKNQPCKFNPEY